MTPRIMPNSGGNEQRSEGQFDRHGQAFGQHLGDRPAKAHRIAQIAGDDTTHIIAKLDGNRLVQAIALHKGVADLVGGLFAQHGAAGIARNQAS